MKEKKIHIEILRVLAILMVCFNHTSSSGFQAYVLAGSTFKYILFFLFSFLSKAAVPLFFMISGALLIPKEESIAQLYRKRVSRIVVVLLLFSLFYYLQFFCGFDLSRFSLHEFIDNFNHCTISTPLWYLYAYLAMLICLPLLRRLADAMKDDEYKYLFLAGLALQTYEMIFQVENLDCFQIAILNQIVFFPLMGHYLENRMRKEEYNTDNAWKMFALFLIYALANALLCVLRVRNSEDPWMQFYLFKGLYSSAIPVWFLITALVKNHPVSSGLSKLFLTLGSCCFGIYLIENELRTFVYYPLYDRLQPILTSMPASFLCVLIEFIVGFVLIYLVRRIKPVRSIL